MFATRRAVFALAAIAALALAAAPSAQAQTTHFASVATPIAIAPHAISPGVKDAKRLFEEGRWREARRAYEEAVDVARNSGDYDPDALTGLANLKYIMEDVRGAAATFDELGQQAAKYGDPETELTAFFNSALLFQEAKDSRGAAARVSQIKALLKSPVISEQTREMVAKRVG
jgi:hypothetical protein